MTRKPAVDAAELPEDWWTSADCATALGIGYSTWTAYVSRGQAPPPAPRKFGRSPVWRPQVVLEWRRRRLTSRSRP